MNAKILFLVEFCKLIGRLGDAASRNDTHAFLQLLKLIRQVCDTVERNLRFRVVDIEDDVDDDDL